MNYDKDSSTSAPRQQNVVLATPYGELIISKDGAGEHAAMKARQLNAFLTMVSGEGQQAFSGLNGDLQNSLLWMLSQVAGELDDLLSQVSITEKQVVK